MINNSALSLFGGAAHALIIDIYQQTNTDLSISNQAFSTVITYKNLSTLTFDSTGLTSAQYRDHLFNFW